jgi:hypothetical protein
LRLAALGNIAGMRPGPAVLALALAAACGREPPAASREQAIADRLPPAMRARAAAAHVPVLLPRAIGLERAHLVAERGFTALSVPLDGVTVSVHSVRVAHDVPAAAAAGAGAPRAMRGTVGYTTVNEHIRTATWIEGGVAHALDLECAVPTDARCADEALLLSLVESLAP